MLSTHTPPCCQAGAEFSFDFLLLLLLASAIAFMGLLESSSVVLGTAAFFSIFVQYQNFLYMFNDNKIIELLSFWLLRQREI
jgi:hypothetical protein